MFVHTSLIELIAVGVIFVLGFWLGRKSKR